MSTPITADPIPLEQAIQWARMWRDGDHHLQANSFLIEADDFRALLAEKTIAYVRLYLCLREENGEIIEKLICVGANDRKQDMILGLHTNDTSGIYDFSHPCPATCD